MAPRCPIDISDNFYRELGRVHKQLDQIVDSPALERLRQRDRAEYMLRVAERKLQFVKTRIDMVNCVLQSNPTHLTSKKLFWALSCRRVFYQAQVDSSRAVVAGKNLEERIRPLQDARTNLGSTFRGFAYAREMVRKLDEEIVRVTRETPQARGRSQEERTAQPPSVSSKPKVPPIKNYEQEIVSMERALSASVRGESRSGEQAAQRKLRIIEDMQRRAQQIVDDNPENALSQRYLYALKCRRVFYQAQVDSFRAAAAGKKLEQRLEPFQKARKYIERYFGDTPYGKIMLKKLDQEIARVTREMPRESRPPSPPSPRPEAPPPKPRRVPAPLPELNPYENLPRREVGRRPEWNRNVFLSFDDGPEEKSSPALVRFIDHIERQGVVGYRFYWNGINCLSPEARKKMKNTEPGKWRAFVDAYRGELSREEYIYHHLLDPGFIRLAASLKQYYNGSIRALEEHIGYHGMIHPNPSSWRHLQNLTAAQIQDDILFYQELLRVAFREPTFTVRYGRPPHGGGFFVRQNSGKPRHMQQAVQGLDFEWRLWRTDPRDFSTGGKIDAERYAKHALDNADTPIAPWDSGQNEILLHEKHHVNDPRQVDGLIDALEKEQRGIKLELGSWTPGKINDMLSRAWARYTDPGERQRYIGERFLQIPFKKKRKHAGEKIDIGGEKREKLVINLATFDCTSFVITTIALAHSRTFDEFLDNFRAIKYRDGRVSWDQKIHYTATRLDEGMRAGLFEDVTSQIGGDTLVTERKYLTRLESHTPPVRLPEHERVRDVTYIPSAKLAQAEHNLRDGDVIFFVANKNKFPDIEFVHQAFVVIENGRVYFLHAKSGKDVRYEEWYEGARKGEKRGLSSYVLDNRSVFSGVVVMRPKNPDQRYS